MKVNILVPSMGSNLSVLDIHSGWITSLKWKDNASGKLVLWERKISGSVPHILTLWLLERQIWGKNQISSVNKAGIKLSASFYKCLSLIITSISPKSFIRPSTIDLVVLIFLTSKQSFHILTPLTVMPSTFHFSFLSVLHHSQTYLYFFQSPLHLPHTLIQFYLFLDLHRGE